MKTTLLTISALCILAATLPSFAHHSFVADYDSDRPATVEGTVKEFWFENPHVRIYLEVETDNGEKQLWEVETMTPSILRRIGWTRTTFKPGDKMTVHGSLARNGATRLSLQEITLADGRSIVPRPTGSERKAFYD